VFLEIEYIEVLEASEATQMKKQANRNYFALRHYRRALGRLAKKKRACSLIKIFAELIYKTKNITNFRVVNHLFFMFKYLYISNLNINIITLID